MTKLRNPGRQRGVSLIEALVALAVMAFGMLSLVGVQATLRLNNDLSKQRTEATRIASEELENVRNFAVMAAVNGQANIAWDEIASRTVDAYVPPNAIGNVSYTVTRTVVAQVFGNDQNESPRKMVSVTVSWIDRAGDRQQVVLDTVVGGTEPALSGLLAVLPQPSPINQSNGRHPSIPPEAVTLQDDPSRSAFKPFDSGGVVWVFNNLTGEVTSRCTGVAVVQADLNRVARLGESCENINGRLLAGEVGFNFRFAAHDLNDTEAVLKPADNDRLVWKLSRDQRRIVARCRTGSSDPTGELRSRDLDDCRTLSLARDVAPYQTNCGNTPCTDSGSLVASDSEAPAWPALNLHIRRIEDITSGHTQSRAPECVDNAPQTSAESLSRVERTVRYFCLVYPLDANGWGGRFDVQPAGFADTDNNREPWTAGADGQFKVCRYSTDTPADGDTNADFTLNADHPRTYCMEAAGSATDARPCTGRRVTGNLLNQNFLIIAASKNCPADTAVNATTGNLVNSNTRQHQP